MAFYNKKEQLYLEKDVLGVSLGVSLLQASDRMQFPRNETPNNVVLWPIVFANKNLTSAETDHSSIEREALGTPHDLETFHHYYFSHEVSVITEHKLLVAIFEKDTACLLHRLQRILLQIHQYNIRLLYKPVP